MDIPWTFGPASIAAFIAFIGILIFVHELGHFLAAKYFDVKVVKFSLGFGPALLAFKRGETTYQIALVPLGGFVKMVGDHPGEEVDPEDQSRAFTTAPIYQRTVIALAGPVFNLVFPIICFFAYNVLGPTVVSPIVGQIEIGQPAERAGLKTGDRILSVDGQRTWSFRRITEVISARPGKTIPVEVERDGQKLVLEVTPEATVDEDLFGGRKERGLIHVQWTRAATRVGVTDPAKAPAFRTGDRILRVGDVEVRVLEDLVPAFRSHAGGRVEVVVARPEPLASGGLLYASAHRPETLEVDAPVSVDRLEDLGLESSEMFVRAVVPGGAAERAGLVPGDRILAVNGRRISLFWSFISEAKRAEVRPIEVLVNRGGQELALSLENDVLECEHEVTRKPLKVFDPGLGMGRLGSAPACEKIFERQQYLSHWGSSVAPDTEKAELGLGEALVTSVEQTGEVIGFVATGLYKLFAAEISVENVGGPIRLFQLAAQAAEVGVFAYLRMLALISVNLGLINLLPIPIFDGGHLMFCAIEAIKRKPVSVRAREAASIIGLVLLFALLALALRNDILSLGIF